MIEEHPATGPVHDIRPDQPRWTHVALRVADIEASIAWYDEFTPLELLERRADNDGFGAWLGHSDAADRPFVLVLAQFLPDHDPYAGTPYGSLRPFAHLGIELPDQEAVDAVAARGEAAGCLAFPAKHMPPPIGYICMLSDPDGNMVEFSFDQGVYATARAVWGDRGDAPAQ
jgi:catechol 2,3-dioxygenase-like lactoylglutathione lyase family enzyme